MLKKSYSTDLTAKSMRNFHVEPVFASFVSIEMNAFGVTEMTEPIQNLKTPAYSTGWRGRERQKLRSLDPERRMGEGEGGERGWVRHLL